MIARGEPHPCSPTRARAADGACLVACAHGGQVLGWGPAGCGGCDRLWLSPLARCGPGETVRGGIPVIFPQGAGRGPLSRHGLAHDRAWELATGSNGAPVARVAAELHDDALTRAIWPHPFTLTLVAEAAGRELALTLTVRNDAPPGGSSFTLTAALQAHLAVHTDRAALTGLAGFEAEDDAGSGTVVRLPDGSLPVGGPMNLAVRGARGPVILDDGLGGRLEICCDDPDGFDSLVVWNPGPEHDLEDVPPGGDRQFVRVEPARLATVCVEPQGVWSASVRLTALVP